MNELKPCPFCGSKDVEVTAFLPFGYPGISKVVTCDNCGCQGPLSSTETEAIEKWNDRKGESNG